MSLPPFPFKVKTKVSWAGEEEGDLGFIENEVVEVFSVVDDSWWNGKLRRNNAEGIFPKDYVKIIEDPYSQTNTPSAPNTPVKEEKRSGNGNGINNNKFSTPDTSYDNIEKLSKSTDPYRKHKYKSSPSPSPQRHRHKKHRNPQDEMLQRQMEIDKFKLLQQQQHYHVKKAEENYGYNNSKLGLYNQRDFGRNSIANFPDSSPKSKSKSPMSSKFKHQSQFIHSNDPYMAKHDSSPNFKSYSGIPNSPSNPNLFNNRTVESFTPETSPKHSNQYQQQSDNDLDDIILKKKQLELELLQLEELRRSTIQMKRNQYSNSAINQKQPISPNRMAMYQEASFDNSRDSSYVSEDLISSKRNYRSRDDLGKKLSNYATDEELTFQKIDHDADIIDDGSPSGSPPPPPPPKRALNGDFDDIDAVEYDDDQYQNEDGPIAPTPEEYMKSRVPYDADDFEFSNGPKIFQLSDNELSSLSQRQQEELKNSIKSLQSDVLNLSELSATSAGSFIRHKQEKNQADYELKMKNLSINENGDNFLKSELNGDNNELGHNKNIMDTMFQDKKSKHPNIFKKLLKRKDESTNPLEQKMQMEEQVDWTTFKKDLNRMNTLTSQDKQSRTKRVVRQEVNFIVKPLDFISDINTNETINDDYQPLELDPVGFTKIDSFALRYSHDTDLNDFITDVSVKFNSSKINQVRAVLIHFMGFKIIEETGKISQTKPKLQELLYKGEGSIFQLNYLFKKVLDALRIPSEMVLGFWKKPNEFYHNEQYVVNHCWLSVLVEEQFLIIDLLNFKQGSVCNVRDHPKGYNEFYFLSKPLTLLSTHIPSIIDLQHVVPPLDQNVAFYLPRTYSGFAKSNLQFKNYNNALSRLKDLEIFELDLLIPKDIELFTLIKTSKITTNEYSLCQIYWVNNVRYAKIKAILPEKESIGVLQVFAGPKGLQKHFDNIHELAIVIPIHHEGEYKANMFVPRYPTVQSQNHDLYIKHPQTSKVIVKNNYNFEILQHPSQGINSGSSLLVQDFKIVIESPSGKYFKLNKTDDMKPYGSFESMIRCQELGLYRGLVIGDSGNSWYVFAQWECVAGTVTN